MPASFFFCFIFVREIEENVTFPLKDIYLQHSTSMIYCFSLEGRHGYSLIKGVTGNGFSKQCKSELCSITMRIEFYSILQGIQHKANFSSKLKVSPVIFGILSYIKK